MAFLTKEHADALCTTILIGFIKSGTGSQFVCESDEKSKCDSVAELLSAVGAPLEVHLQDTDTANKFIVAKTSRIPSMRNIDLYNKYIQALERHVNALSSSKKPRGAYIGGLSTTSTIHLIGPSALATYPPQFRRIEPIDQTAITAAYKNAVESTNTSVKCIRDMTCTDKEVKISTADMPKGEIATTDIAPNTLFHSYHGMIQAMVKYQSDPDKNDFIFELALGNNTKKIGSCVPCSIFMTAAGNPATTTHLGRGDNWSLPQGGGMYGAAWKEEINAYYKSGLATAAGNPKISALPALFLTNHITERNIPDVFLEALTFESSFADKVTVTLA